MEKTGKVFGKTLARLRIAMGMNQEELARYLGIATSTLRLFEQGRDLSPRLDARVSQRVQTMHHHFPELVSDPALRKLFFESMGDSPLEPLGDSDDVTKRHWQKLDFLNRWQILMVKALTSTGTADAEDSAEEANIMGTISSKLLMTFTAEKERRQLTSSELLESILTFYYDNIVVLWPILCELVNRDSEESTHKRR
jgi:transcriptional regulator with XRE-family HTH domain